VVLVAGVILRAIQAKWEDASDSDPVGLWSRGCRKTQWSLVPNLYRIIDESSDDEQEDWHPRAIPQTCSCVGRERNQRTRGNGIFSGKHADS